MLTGVRAEPTKVFVYGTLKRGQRNFVVAQGAGWLESQPAWISGYQLYHLPQRPARPYPYPALTPGAGRVYGELQRYASLARALSVLDELESEGYEYRRVVAPVWRAPTGQGAPVCQAAWLYVYLSPTALEQQGAQKLPAGTWPLGRSAQS